MTHPSMTTGSSDEYIEKLIAIVAYGFSASAITLRAIVETDAAQSKPTTRSSISRRRLEEHFAPSCYALTRDGAIIAEAGNFAAAALWEPPGFVLKNPPTNPDGSRAGPVGRTIDEFRAIASNIKRKCLGDEAMDEARYWHLSRIARAEDRNEKGVVSAIIKPFLEKAKQDGVPVWLESVAENAKNMYLHFGFEVVDEIIIGVGRLDAKGDENQSGEGILSWAMVKWP
ncbi:MAG: hypothetical protein Q9160_004747 [Pyrenula sp. 1 TL-2023]